MKEKSYSIHNLIKFKIRGEPGVLGKLITNFRFQYKNFETSESIEPDLIFTLGDFLPSKQGCFVLDDDYYVNNDYLYCQDSYKMAKWKLEIQGFEATRFDVHIDANLFGWELVSGFIIDPLIFLKLNENGYSVVHGSCISNNERAYVFSAQGGGGKTSTALFAIEKGYKFLGDNYVIINQGRVLSFLYPLNLFFFNLTPWLRNNIKTSTRIKIELIRISESLTGLGMATKVNPKILFPASVSDNAELIRVFLLLPRNKFHTIELERYEMVDHLVENLKLDITPFIKYLMEYIYVFPMSKMSHFWQDYRENLKKNLSGSQFFKIEVPTKFSFDVFKEIETLLI